MEPVTLGRRLPSVPEVGELVKGKYRLLRLLGDGGMGSVYEARHEGLGTKVALKFLHPRLSRWPELVQRFLDEARLAAPIRSPEVVQVLDVDQSEEGLAFIVLELLSGQTLRELLDRRRLAETEARAFAVQLCDGLEAVHEAGIVHRDLKPENVMVTRETSGEPRLKLLDFGIAMPDGAGDRGSLPGAVLGTPGYMAPEQVNAAGSVDARADLYSLGVLLFEMLTGRLPGEGVDLAAIAPGLAPELALAIARAMAPSPGDRFGSAAELRGVIAPRSPSYARMSVALGLLELSPSPPSGRVSRTSVEVPFFITPAPVSAPASAFAPAPVSAFAPAPAPAPVSAPASAFAPAPAPAPVSAFAPAPVSATVSAPAPVSATASASASVSAPASASVPRRNHRIWAAVALALMAGIALGGSATVLIPRGSSGAEHTPNSVVVAMMAAPSTAVEADPAPSAPGPEVAPADDLPPSLPNRVAPLSSRGVPTVVEAAPRPPAGLGPPLVPPPHRRADLPARLPAVPQTDALRPQPDPWPGSRPPKHPPPRADRREPRDPPPRDVIILVPVGPHRREAQRQVIELIQP